MFSESESFNLDVSYTTSMADKIFDAVEQNNEEQIRKYGLSLVQKLIQDKKEQKYNEDKLLNELL